MGTGTPADVIASFVRPSRPTGAPAVTDLVARRRMVSRG
jgi:hypothetical protein